MKRQIWGKKKNYKKAAVAIELLFLVVMIFLFFMFFHIQKSRLTSEAAEELQQLWTGMEQLVSMDQGTVEDALFLVAETHSGFKDDVAQADYGIAMEVYGKDGNVIGQTDLLNQKIVWDPMEEPDREYEWYDLDSYFSQENIEELTEFYRETYRHYQCAPVILQMTGYYQNEQFIPVKIEFCDKYEGGTIFTLINHDTSSNGNVVRRQIYRDYAETVVSDNNVEYGTLTPYMDNTRPKVQKKVWEILREEVSDWKALMELDLTGTRQAQNEVVSTLIATDNAEIGGYVLAGYIDVRNLTWHSHDFWNWVIKTLIFCQVLAAIFIKVYCYIGKKQHQFTVMRNTFINAIAHEMKTPVSVIKTCVEYQEIGAQEKKKEHYRRVAIREADHLNELLSGMLTYTRVSDLSCEILRKDCRITGLAESVCDHYRTAIEQKNVKLEFVCEPDYAINADEKMLEIVLDNLISNAVKYCKEGGHVRISAERTRVSVYNEGNPVPEDQIKHIWEPLYRGDEARTAEEGSSGMGLAICENIFKIHGFSYGVENAADGVVFWFDAKGNRHKNNPNIFGSETFSI